MNSINVSSFSPKIRGVPRVPSHIYHFWWGGAMVIGYRVYANTGIDDSLSLVFDGSGSPSVRSFKHTGLTPGRRYWYQVGKTWGKHMEMIGSEGSSFLRSTTEIFTYWQWIYSYNFCLWQKRGNSGSNAYHLSASFPFFPKKHHYYSCCSSLKPSYIRTLQKSGPQCFCAFHGYHSSIY